MMFFRASRSTLRLIGAYFVANLQASMEYRAAFWASVSLMFINDGLWLFFWLSYFHQFPLVDGWQQSDVIVLWSITAFGVGLSHAVFGNTKNLTQLIMTGGLDAYLGMPRNVLLHTCLAGSDPASWGDILFGCGAYIVLVHPGPLGLVLYLALSVLVALVFTAFVVIFSALAFFLGNTDGLVQQMVGALVTFATYPMSIFNGAVKVLLFTLIPAGFISFVPLQLLHQFTWPLVGAMLGFTLLILLCAAGLFQLGLKRYESGNLLGMQN